MLVVRNILLSFGGPPLLDQVTLDIQPGNRICIVGRNGAGKSTLLKVIAQTISPDDGEFIKEGPIQIQELPQEIPDTIEGTIETILHQELLNRDLQDWEIERDIDNILEGSQLERNFRYNDLSAGLKRRTILCRCMAGQPDLLLLDEPTNHLDIESIEWLETYLKRFKGAVVFITHDRSFLQNVATSIADLDRGRLTHYHCDYNTYLNRKEQLLEAEEKQNANFDTKLAQEEAWIRQGIKARRTRNEGRVRALKRMREAHKNRRSQVGSSKLNIEQANATGLKVIEAKSIHFAFPDLKIVDSFSLQIDRGDRLGIIGKNGTGKTTLLNLLLKKLEPQSGTIEHGSNLQIAYFDQLREQLDPEATLIDCVADGNDSVMLNGKSIHVISYLKNFLFSPDRVRGKVKMLSGGEKNRLLLARLFTRPFNVLIMDEPTNDLDIETLELLEELLGEFTGTLILVSHDRAFINNVVTDVVAVEGNGKVKCVAGGYDDYLAQREIYSPKATNQKIPTQKPQRSEKPRKFLNRERWELEALPKEIEELEERLSQLTEQMAYPDFYKNSPEKIEKTKLEIHETESTISQKFERWEALETLRKELEQS